MTLLKLSLRSEKLRLRCFGETTRQVYRRRKRAFTLLCQMFSDVNARSAEPVAPAKRKSRVSTIFWEQSRECAASNCTPDKAARSIARPLQVTLLTGGGDKPYHLGL